jgi:quercetin dioxygenase-like cupin family protein
MKIWMISLMTTVILLSSCEPNYPEKIEKVILAESIKSWDGRTLPNYPTGQPKISILKFTIPPKTTMARHIHPVINAGVVLKGELTVVDEHDNVLILKAGDPIVELVNTIHYGINEGNEAVEIIVFYAGTEESAITIVEK